MKRWIRIAAVLALVGLAAPALQAAPFLIPILLLIVGFWALARYINGQRVQQVTGAVLSRFEGFPVSDRLDPELARLGAQSPKLRGDTTYDYPISGESFYREAFEQLLGRSGLGDGDDMDYVGLVLIEPQNRHSKNAVAVFVDGLKLGYIPEGKAPELYAFLLRHTGIARVDCVVGFEVEKGLSHIWLDLVEPYHF